MCLLDPQFSISNLRFLIWGGLGAQFLEVWRPCLEVSALGLGGIGSRGAKTLKNYCFSNGFRGGPGFWHHGQVVVNSTVSGPKAELGGLSSWAWWYRLPGSQNLETLKKTSVLQWF